MFDKWLEYLVCPQCKGKLIYQEQGPASSHASKTHLSFEGSVHDNSGYRCEDGVWEEGPALLCTTDHIAFPIREGIPVMLLPMVVDEKTHSVI